MLMRVRLNIPACFGVLSCVALTHAADLPEQLQKEIDKSRSAYEEGCKAADKKLLSALEAEIELVRKQVGLKAEAKQQAIDGLDAEREAFEKHAAIPFSPRMRTASVSYLKAYRQHARPAEVAYDKAIEYMIKAKDDLSSASLVAEKKKALNKSKVVATLELTNPNTKAVYIITLHADGTGNGPKQSWTLNKDNLVIISSIPGSPEGGWVDTCVFGPGGRRFQAKNQNGDVQTGKCISPISVKK
jgi:hypothetical protein